MHDQRRGARPQRGTDDLPAPHAALQGRRRDLRSSRGAPGLPGGQGPGGRPRAPSTASSPAGGFISRHDRQRAGRRTPSRSPRTTPTAPWTPPRASAAAPASPPAPTPRPCSSPPAKVAHLALLPQGQPERQRRALAHGGADGAEGFGSCTNYGECEAACPKEISIDTIARMNRDYLRAVLALRPAAADQSNG